MPLAFLKLVCCLWFCGCSFSVGLSAVSSTLDAGSAFLVGILQRWHVSLSVIISGDTWGRFVPFLVMLPAITRLRVVAARFLHCRVTVFLFVINTYLQWDSLRPGQYSVYPANFHPLFLISIDDSCRNQLLLCYLLLMLVRFHHFFYTCHFAFYWKEELFLGIPWWRHG